MAISMFLLVSVRNMTKCWNKMNVSYVMDDNDLQIVCIPFADGCRQDIIPVSYNKQKSG